MTPDGDSAPVEQPLRASHTTAVVAIGVLATFGNGVMPTQLGAAAADGILTSAQIGVAATVQASALFLTLTLCNIFMPFIRLRMISTVAILVMAAGQFLAAAAPDALTLILSRALTGAPEGVLMWLAMGGVVRSQQPVRAGGAQIMSTGLVRIGVVALLTMVLIPSFGARPGFVVLGLCVLLGVLAVPFLPREFAVTTKPDDPKAPRRASARRGIPLFGVLSLTVVFFIAPSVQIVTLYTVPLATEFGYETGGNLALNLMSVGTLLGGGLAMLLGGRLGYRTVLVTSFVLISGLALTALLVPDQFVFGVALGLMTLLDFFRFSFFIALHLASDPSKRTALFHSSVVMVSSIVMQALAASAVAAAGIESVIALALGTGAIGIVLLLWLSVLISRKKARGIERISTRDQLPYSASDPLTS